MTQNIRRVNKICLHGGYFIHCYILLNFVLFFNSSWQSVTIQFMTDSLWLTLMLLQNMKINRLNFLLGLSNFNIIPLLHIMLNFVGQHHTGGISYTSINNNGYFQGIYALCKHIISLTKFTSFSVCRWNVKFSHV